jgi:hypothetical protein
VFCECRRHLFQFKRDYSNSGDVKKSICGRSTLLSILHYITHWGSNPTFFNISTCKIIWNSKYQFMVNISSRQPIFNFNRKDQHYKKEKYDEYIFWTSQNLWILILCCDYLWEYVNYSFYSVCNSIILLSVSK